MTLTTAQHRQKCALVEYLYTLPPDEITDLFLLWASTRSTKEKRSIASAIDRMADRDEPVPNTMERKQ